MNDINKFLNSKVTQSDFAVIIGVSKGAVSGYVKKEIIEQDGVLGDWLLSYCTNLGTDQTRFTLSNNSQ